MSHAPALEIGLNAAIVTVEVDQPQILIVKPTGPTSVNSHNIWDGLPYGPFSPTTHRTLESGLRDWVSDQTGLDLGYAEQLYTFGDRGRHQTADGDQSHTVSIGYLALTRETEDQRMVSGFWRNWYSYLPWEDWRNGRPDILDTDILPKLIDWLEYADTHHGALRAKEARERVRICFGHDGGEWDEEKVLERYELLYEAGLVPEAERDKGVPLNENTMHAQFGHPMRDDHRRMLATAMGRLRGKIKYRPVVFELMHDEFTLFELQKTVEAILGSHLHKQNFRRLVENAGLVEATGELRTHTGGRPAKLYRFRKDVLHERPAPGVRVKPGRAV